MSEFLFGAEGVGLEPTSPLRGAGFQDQFLTNSEHPSNHPYSILDSKLFSSKIETVSFVPCSGPIVKWYNACMACRKREFDSP